MKTYKIDPSKDLTAVDTVVLVADLEHEIANDFPCKLMRRDAHRLASEFVNNMIAVVEEDHEESDYSTVVDLYNASQWRECFYDIVNRSHMPKFGSLFLRLIRRYLKIRINPFADDEITDEDADLISDLYEWFEASFEDILYYRVNWDLMPD